MQNSQAKKSIIRWWILLLLCFMYLITFMDRVNISVVAPAVSKEFNFDKITMGFIFGAFSLAFALGQIPGGWMGDRFGPRKVLTTIVVYWSLMTIATAQAFSYLSFLVIRFFFGLGEAGAFPTATRAMQFWYPKSERGFIQGITHSFSRFGAAVVPPIAVSIMALWGWRAVFYVFGGAGVLWAICFYFVYRNRPEDHAGVNEAELAYIREAAEQGGRLQAHSVTDRPAVPWKTIFSTPNMWYICASYFCWNYNIFFFMTWLPSYLVEYRHFSLATMGFLASLPLLAGMIGDTVGGMLTDLVLKKTKKLKLARRIIAAPSMLLSAIFMVPAAVTSDPYMAVYCLAGSMFFLECVIAVAWAIPMDVGGQYTGTVSGVMTMAGNLAGVVSPIAFGFLVQGGSWIAPFYLQALMLTIGAFIWAFLLNPEKSVVGKS
ncbi:MAG: MFS transporter [Negativicutes bacterium]|nr:MFS transporter [Negativicutes bacterium]